MVKSTDRSKSRYVQGGTTDIYPTRLGWWERRTFPKDISDEVFTITTKYHQRPHKLASDKYGFVEYMSFILQYNGILDINTEFVEGAIIYLPTSQRLSLDLSAKTVGGNIING
jgi:hypothetical protein